MKNYRSIKEIVEDLRDEPFEISEFELLSLAVQIQRNEIISAGLSVSPDSTLPSPLEAIATQLGYKPNGSVTLNDMLGEIADNLIKE